MSACVAVGPFKLTGDVDEFTDLRIFVVLLTEVGALFEGLVERDAQRLRHHLSKLSDAGQRNIQYSTHVLDRRSSCHRAKCRNLGDTGLAITLANIGDDF